MSKQINLTAQFELLVKGVPHTQNLDSDDKEPTEIPLTEEMWKKAVTVLSLSEEERKDFIYCVTHGGYYKLPEYTSEMDKYLPLISESIKKGKVNMTV